MIDYLNISESLYSAAANSIRTLTEHYAGMLGAGVPPQDVLTRLVQHLDRINMSTADEASKTKAKAELLAFIQNNMLVANQGDWDVVSGLFDDGWTPAGWVKEDLDEAATSSTHVLFLPTLKRFHGLVNGKSVKPTDEAGLHRHLRDNGYDKYTAADMIGHFKSGGPSGERLHNSTASVDGALRHSQMALASHLAGNHAMRDSHLKVADVHMDAALGSLNKDDPGVVHHLPNKLNTLHNTIKAIR